MLESYIPIGLGVSVSILAYAFLLYLSKRLQNGAANTKYGGRYWKKEDVIENTSQPTDDFTECRSPECVRCNKYRKVKDAARKKLVKFTKENGWSGLERMKSMLLCNELPKNTKKNSQLNDDYQSMQRNFQVPNVLFFEGLSAHPWWRSSHFREERQILENNFDIIYEEFQLVTSDLRNRDNDPQKPADGWIMNNTPAGYWCVYHLFNQGTKVEASCARCPETASIIESLPRFMEGCIFGNASFSVIYPQTFITEHYGPSNVRIRCHLGLSIPAHCSLTVAGETRMWKEGECFFFDDSFLHEAEHLGEIHSEPRGVLLCDFWHPNLSTKEVNAIKYAY